MKHLSDERLVNLAHKINLELDFTREDQRDMLHISACEECYQLLRLTMLVADATDHIGETVVAKKKQQFESAVIRVVIVNMAAAIEQLQAERNSWRFSEALDFAGVRSADAGQPMPTKLEDEDNVRTFVTYDPVSKTLAIQLDADTVSSSPRAFLQRADGIRQEIPLEKQGDTYWGEIAGLEDGEFRIILEK